MFMTGTRNFINLTCSICNNEFESLNSAKKTCSKLCLSKLVSQNRTGKPMIRTHYAGKPILKDDEASKFKFYSQACEFKLTSTDIEKIPGVNLLREFGMWSPTNKEGVVRDHIFSRREGFLQEIPYTVISHPANCQYIRMSENTSKKDSCSITLEELYRRISIWDESPKLVSTTLFKSDRPKKQPKPKNFTEVTITKNGKTKSVKRNQVPAYRKCGWEKV